MTACLTARRRARSQTRRCSLACVYCQLGHTTHMRVTRQPWLTPEAQVVAAERELLIRCEYNGTTFYLRRVSK